MHLVTMKGILTGALGDCARERKGIPRTRYNHEWTSIIIAGTYSNFAIDSVYETANGDIHFHLYHGMLRIQGAVGATS